MAVMAFGVLISTTSPGFIRAFETATEMRPSPSCTVATPGTSVMVSTDRSRAVTVALPPSSTRTNDRSPVVMRSRRNTASLNCRGCAPGSLRRATVAVPSMLVTTPTRSPAIVEDASRNAAAAVSSSAAINRFARAISPLPSVGGAVPSAQRKEGEQAKCHSIPDFREIEIKRFSQISTTGRPRTGGRARARLAASGQTGASHAIPDSCVRAGVGLRSLSLADSREKEPHMALRVISADSHMDLIYLPQDTFTSRMASAWRDRAPRVVERDGRLMWISGDAVLGPWGVYGPGVTGGRRGRILAEAGFASGKQTRPSNTIERSQDQDRDGVAGEVIYGIIGISRGLFTHSGIADHETLAAVYRAYNDYIADFNRTAPGRFFGLGCLPNHDARAAADEVRHCAELGLRGGVFVPWGAAAPVWDVAWEPLWSAAEETGLVISFHVFEGGATTVGYAVKGGQHPASAGSWTVVAPLQMDEICASVILSGVCERHPKLTLVLGESGIGWLPYMLERLDDTYEERLADDLGLKLPPSAYFKRQMYATFQKDFHGVRAMAEVAPDNVMWGSDYPHRDGTWPFSQKAIEEQFRGFPEKIQAKMLWENVRRVYRIAS